MQPLLDKLVAENVLDPQGARRVRALRAEGRGLDEALRACSAVTEDRLLRFLAGEFDLPYVEVDACQLDAKLVSRFPAKILLDHQLLPLREENGALVVIASRLFDTTGTDELRVAADRDIRVALAPAADIERTLHQLLGVGADTLQTLTEGIEILDEQPGDDIDLADDAEDASIIKFVNQVLTEAIGRRATDVHFEPFEDQLRVRYRIDGVLAEANIPPSVSRFRAAIVSRLKILSHLDIAEKRLPQDGRVKLKVSGREIDVRVSVIPMLHGEAVVLRLLDRSATMLGLENLGMGADDFRTFRRILGLPHGIVLVTGPTGSGKTTTLYAGLAEINKIDRKIVTIEDPIEYELRGVNQIQVSDKAGLTFARGLRSILRHDPDVILVGEIRDRETAAIAVQASLTGHLVFSTLHTNDAPGALTRLVDMGIEPYLVASSLELVMAQRLVRLICPACREELPEPEAERVRAELGDELPATLYRGRGCRECQGCGYRGRQGIFEMMPVSDEIRAMLLNNASANEIRKIAVTEGLNGLREDGLRQVWTGRTTLEEVLRVTKDDRSNGNGTTGGGHRRAPASPEDAAAAPVPEQD
jgi:general secretion pathway protein E/type IV pilus assembly protein PilB